MNNAKKPLSSSDGRGLVGRKIVRVLKGRDGDGNRLIVGVELDNGIRLIAHGQEEDAEIIGMILVCCRPEAKP